eukprot:5829755-Prymnesium_polylepis.2
MPELPQSDDEVKIRLPAGLRRRLARSRPRSASLRRRLASRGACAPLASRRRRLPLLALDSTRQTVSAAGVEPCARAVRPTAPQAQAPQGITTLSV